MKDFRAYLENKNLVDSSINRRIRLVERWLKWLTKSIEKSSYQDLLTYIETLQQDDKTISHINAVLLAISDYYDYQQLPNLAINTRLKGQVTKALTHPIKAEELDQIYQTFEGDEIEKVILGLIIYQGLEQSDFTTIEAKDIDLGKGTIYIPSRKERNSRILALEAHQILQLNSFLSSTEKAFSPYIDTLHHFQYILSKLSKKVKEQAQEKLNITVTKLSHLRQSRIAIWVKEEGIRQGQYKAGFKRVMSAEKYLKADLTDLKEQIKLHHPLK